MSTLLLTLIATATLAAPPSSTLTGPEGTLSWDIHTEPTAVTIHGSSPKWTVEHTAKADLTPIRTVHTDTEGATTTIDFAPDGVVVKLPGKELRHSRADLWDGDTLDVRLGANVAAGRAELAFHAVDTGSGKVYSFDVHKVADEQCGAQACTHLLVQLTGLLRYVGPSWNYWYAADGRLLRFEGPAGTFAAEGAK